MLTDPQTTLAYHQSRVLTSHRDMSHVSCKAVGPMIKKYMDADSKSGTKPDTEALWFYGLNHGMALIRAARHPLEPMDEWEQKFVTNYHSLLAPKAIRAFYYLLLICTREFRHNKSLSQNGGEIGKMFGQENYKFFQSIKGGEHGISSAFMATPPDSTLGSYVRALEWGFNNCSWNGGYGGKKWGNVTNCLVHFVDGTYTAEMMLDTVWTLAHNGGPIFNKGMLYSHHSHTLTRLLDVQRAGQMPAGILYDETLAAYAEAGLVSYMHELYMRYPKEFTKKYVDWEMVEALGAVGSYSVDKAKQAKVHGLSPEAQAALEAKKAAQIEAALAAKKAQEEYDKMHLTIMPGLVVKKFEPVRVAA